MKRRILSLILVLCMLLSTAVLFASCGKKKVELTGYNVVCGKDTSASMLNEITDFANSIKAKTGEKVSVKKVKADDALDNEDDLEILIGNTNRPETAKALKKVKGHGYTVTVVGKKIVIVGTTNLLTALALDHFKTACLSGDVTAITVEKTVVSDLPMTEITSATAFIYSANLLDNTDFLVEQIKVLQKYLASISDLKGISMPTKTDAESAASEILVGMVKRDESKTFTSGMNAYNYGIGAKNGKLIIAGLGDAMTGKAVELAKGLLQDSVCQIEGKKKIFIPSDFSRIFTDTEGAFFDDFPKPQLPITGTMDVGDNSLEYCYQGEGVNADAYNAYCSTLEAAGYTAYGEQTTAENSIFRTYVNTEKNATLYVSYNAFKHAAAQNVTYYQPAIRVVSASLDAVNLLDDEIVDQDLSYTKITNTSITSVKLSGDMQGVDGKNVYGNNYVVTLEDGSFVVYDGGQSYHENRDRLYEVLRALYVKVHGAEPTTQNPIRIAAWVVSHPHGDHIDLMQALINNYCANYQRWCITVDRLITNLTSDEECYSSSSAHRDLRDVFAEMSSRVSDAPGEEAGIEYIKIHAGQRFYLANVEFEVIHTHEEMYPRRIYIFNNTSNVYRMTVNHTQNGTVSSGSETTLLWLGDAQDDASKCMRAMYGAYLDSDMVQVAHHNYAGSEWELYQLVSPECVWWPVNKTRYSQTCHDPGASSGPNYVNYRINYRLSSVKYIILSDEYNYTLTFTAGGPDYALAPDSPTGVYDPLIPTTKLPMSVGVRKNIAYCYIKTEN